MDRGPAEREERALPPREVEVVEATHLHALRRRLVPRQDDVDLRLDDRVAARVRHPEHEARDRVEAPDHGAAAEEDARRRTRELREREPGEERDPDESDEDLDRHEDVRGERDGDQLPVADRAHRLHAEEEGVGERAGTRVLDAPRRGEVSEREDDVHADERQYEDREQPWPGGREGDVVEVPAEALALGHRASRAPAASVRAASSASSRTMSAAGWTRRTSPAL